MNPVFEFTWTPLRSQKWETTVASYDMEHMKLFLQQHGFDPNTRGVNCLQYPNQSSNESVRKQYDDVFLAQYHFGSRKRDKIYSIYTTQDIVDMIIDDIASDISSSMTLGACALRGEIQIFDRIQSLINELDYAYIMDTDAADASGYDVFDKSEYYGYPYYESIAINQDDSFLYELLHSESVPSRSCQPITIESYVRKFTEIFILGRES